MSTTTTPVNVASQMAGGSQIESIKGTFGRFFERKAGTNKNGEWSFERTTLSDGTGEIRVTFKNCPPVGAAYTGKEVLIESFKNSEGKMTGIRVDIDEYQGKTTKELTVTPSADVSFLKPGEAQQQGSPEPEPEPEPDDRGWPPEPKYNPTQHAPEPEPEPEPQPAKPKATTEMIEAKGTIMQITNLHLLVSKAVDSYHAPELKKSTGHDLSEAQRQGAVASIFIEGCRNGLVHKMPARPLE